MMISLVSHKYTYTERLKDFMVSGEFLLSTGPNIAVYPEWTFSISGTTDSPQFITIYDNAIARIDIWSHSRDNSIYNCRLIQYTPDKDFISIEDATNRIFSQDISVYVSKGGLSIKEVEDLLTIYMKRLMEVLVGFIL